MKVSMLAFSIGIGVASGSQPIIGFNYGAKKYDRVKKTFLLSAGVATIITFVSWIVFQCFPLQLIRIFGTESSLYEEFAVKCFHIYLLLTFLNGLQMCAGVLFQAIGQPMKAAITSLSAGPAADALAFVLSGAFCFKEIKKMEQIGQNAEAQ